MGACPHLRPNPPPTRSVGDNNVRVVTLLFPHPHPHVHGHMHLHPRLHHRTPFPPAHSAAPSSNRCTNALVPCGAASQWVPRQHPRATQPNPHLMPAPPNHPCHPTKSNCHVDLRTTSLFTFRGHNANYILHCI